MLRAARRNVAITHFGAALVDGTPLEGRRLAAAGYAAGAVAAEPQPIAANDQTSADSQAFAQLASPTSTYRPVVSGSVLKRHGRDLTLEAAEGRLDPLIGRQDVLERTLQVLLRRTKNNPVLIGDPGVGKTAVAEGIAQLIASPVAPQGLAGRALIALDVGSLVAGTQYRGAFEERLTSLLREVHMAAGRVILFIDELHMLMDAGLVEGGMNAANLLKPALARGDLHCIGATTVEEYRKHIEADGAFARRFQPVMVEEPVADEAVRWLQGLRQRYERYHGVRFTDAALITAVRAAQQYIPDRRLPDSAIDVIDEAAARARLHAAKAAAAAVAAAHSAAPTEQVQPVASAAAIGTDGFAATAGSTVEHGAQSGSSKETRRLTEWLTAVQPQAAPETHIAAAAWGAAALASEQAGRPSSAGAPGAPGQSAKAAAAPVGQPGGSNIALGANSANALSCPHCGTPAMPVPGSETVTCARCSFTFLSIPQEKLLLGASLFTHTNRHSHSSSYYIQVRQQAQQQQQGRGLQQQAGPPQQPSFKQPQPQQLAAAAAAGRWGPPAPNRQSPGATHSTPSAAAQRGMMPHAANASSYGNSGAVVVDAPEILSVVAEASGIPAEHLSQSDWQSLAALERRLRQRLAGQQEAVEAVVGAVRLGRMGLQRGSRPLASLLLTGPAGVGKGTLCLALAESLFGSDRHLLRFNLAEFSDKASVSRLVGAPPGYVGFGDGGLLTDAVRRRPHSVVLLERVDRAHPEVLSLVIQALETGQLQDSMGKRCSFRNALLVLTTSPTTSPLPAGWTSTAHAAEGTATNERTEVGQGAEAPNLGGQGDSALGTGGEAVSTVSLPDSHPHPFEAHTYADSSSCGSGHNGHSAAAQCLQPETGGTNADRKSSSSLLQPAPAGHGQSQGPLPAMHPLHFLPSELLARLDAVVNMRALSETDMLRVVELQLADCREALGQQGLHLRVDPAAQRWLAAHGVSSASGARRLQLLLREQLLLPAADALVRMRAGEAGQGGADMAAADAPLVVAVTLGESGNKLLVELEGQRSECSNLFAV